MQYMLGNNMYSSVCMQHYEISWNIINIFQDVVSLYYQPFEKILFSTDISKFTLVEEKNIDKCIDIW